jgi:FAD/FMN-containing dehydrogenase
MQQSIVKRLIEKLGDKKVKTDEGTLDERRHDYSVAFQLDDMQGRQAPRPACVAQPAATLDVVKVVNLCRESGTVIIPFGLGSGVVSEGSSRIPSALMPKVPTPRQPPARFPKR